MDYPIICNHCGYPPWLYADQFGDLDDVLHDPQSECPWCHGHDFSVAIGARPEARYNTATPP